VPQLRVRGRQLSCKGDEQEEPWQQQVPLPTRLAGGEVFCAQQPQGTAVTRDEEHTMPMQLRQHGGFEQHQHESGELLQGTGGGELCVNGSQITVLRPPDAALHAPARSPTRAAREQEEGEVIAAHGVLEEVLAIQHDAWEAHVTMNHGPSSGQGACPDHLQQGLGGRAGVAAGYGGQCVTGMASGCEGCPQRLAGDDKDPVQSILEQAVDKALARTWGLLVPTLAPLVARRLHAREAARQQLRTLACDNDNGSSTASEFNH